MAAEPNSKLRRLTKATMAPAFEEFASRHCGHILLMSTWYSVPVGKSSGSADAGESIGKGRIVLREHPKI
jgi:hypothetical protein